MTTIDRMNAHLRSIGSHYGTDDGTTFRTVIPSGEKIIILTKRFGSVEAAEKYIINLRPIEEATASDKATATATR